MVEKCLRHISESSSTTPFNKEILLKSCDSRYIHLLKFYILNFLLLQTFQIFFIIYIYKALLLLLLLLYDKQKKRSNDEFFQEFQKKKLWSIGKPDRDKTPTGGNFPPSENRASGGIFPTECFGLLSKLIVPRQDYSIAHCTMECTMSHVSARLRQVGKTIGHRIALFDNGGFP